VEKELGLGGRWGACAVVRPLDWPRHHRRRSSARFDPRSSARAVRPLVLFALARFVVCCASRRLSGCCLRRWEVHTRLRRRTDMAPERLVSRGDRTRKARGATSPRGARPASCGLLGTAAVVVCKVRFGFWKRPPVMRGFVAICLQREGNWGGAEQTTCSGLPGANPYLLLIVICAGAECWPAGLCSSYDVCVAQ